MTTHAAKLADALEENTFKWLQRECRCHPDKTGTRCHRCHCIALNKELVAAYRESLKEGEVRYRPLLHNIDVIQPGDEFHDRECVWMTYDEDFFGRTYRANHLKPSRRPIRKEQQ